MDPAVLPHDAGIRSLLVSLLGLLVLHQYKQDWAQALSEFPDKCIEEKAPALVEKARKGNHGYRSCLVC